MKKLALLITALLISVALHGQDTHLKFKGIPIDGNYKDFAQKLVQKGFLKIDTSEGSIVLSGNFMAIPDVLVVVYPEPTSKNVSMVMAMIETGDSWALIESKYYNVVDTFKEKYGEPSEHSEEFMTDVYDSDYRRRSALRDGQCNYQTIWDTEYGRIAISPVYVNFKYYIACGYIDVQNVNALHQTIIDDI